MNPTEMLRNFIEMAETHMPTLASKCEFITAPALAAAASMIRGGETENAPELVVLAADESARLSAILLEQRPDLQAKVNAVIEDAIARADEFTGRHSGAGGSN